MPKFKVCLYSFLGKVGGEKCGKAGGREAEGKGLSRERDCGRGLGRRGIYNRLSDITRYIGKLFNYSF